MFLCGFDLDTDQMPHYSEKDWNIFWQIFISKCPKILHASPHGEAAIFHLSPTEICSLIKLSECVKSLIYEIQNGNGDLVTAASWDAVIERFHKKKLQQVKEFLNWAVHQIHKTIFPKADLQGGKKKNPFPTPSPYT